MGEIVVVYAGENPPDSWDASVFVAGPMPRDPCLPSWRPEILAELKAYWAGPGTLVVFVPEARDRHHPDPGYVSQLWEERWMAVIDVIAFVPRDAVSVHYLRRAAETYGTPVLTTLAGTAQATLDLIGDGARRQGTERDVPLLIWHTEAFQRWHAKTDADLCSARLLWSWSPGPAFRLLASATRVQVVRYGAHVDELLIAEPATPDLLISALPSDASPVRLGDR